MLIARAVELCKKSEVVIDRSVQLRNNSASLSQRPAKRPRESVQGSPERPQFS